MCNGEWVKGEQISADYCIPNKNGDCPASCPVKCGENDMVCPGKMGYSGCQDPDYCYSGSKYLRQLPQTTITHIIHSEQSSSVY